MRNLRLLAIILITFLTTGYSQSCLPDGITFATQTQIDNQLLGLFSWYSVTNI